MRVNFNCHTFRAKIKYVCSKCGHKMYRINSDYYTNNPWNTKSNERCLAEIKMHVYEDNKTCPKCNGKCNPVLSAAQKNEYEEAIEISRGFEK